MQNLGGYPSGQRGLTVNQLAEAFGGSNPSPPTLFVADRMYQFSYQRVALYTNALIAQSVEHILGKNGVMGSSPIEGSRSEQNVKIEFVIRRKRKDGEAEI